MKKIVLTAIITMASSINIYANISINSDSYQSVIKINEDGTKKKEWVKAEKVLPGGVVKYVNTLNNDGVETATQLVINNPIPKEMQYLSSSAECQGSCVIYYSVDGGQTFKKPSELFVGLGQERHLAKAEEYTNIRWVLDNLSGNSQSSVGYKARLK